MDETVKLVGCLVGLDWLDCWFVSGWVWFGLILIDWFLLIVNTITLDDLLFQLGTLGAGNHYAEIQAVDEIFDEYAAKKMGIEFKGQVCIMIHCGSRGLGHQVATGMYMCLRVCNML